LPVFRFNKAFTTTRDLKVFLSLHAGVTRGVVPNVDRYKKRVKKLRIARQKNRQLIKEQRKKIKEQRKALNDARRRISENKTKSTQKTQEIFRLKNELHATEERVEGIAEQRYPAAMDENVSSSFASMFPEPRQKHVDDLTLPDLAFQRMDHPVLLVHGRDDGIIPLETRL
jgi:septal ring factor EnvC (AmiA/AmiB activator)